ncbi:uncharacterized protein K02A2.6-like [Cydia strobilella]|uniref:uncharacterized protein K02A2.6-like n=1 Tax=Cydia strobilella TaxID=1100964 RepID=UPI003006919E
MEHARPPAELLLEGGPAARAEAWRKWKKQFMVFLKASGVSKESADVQAGLLVNLIGSAGYEVYTALSLTDTESENITTVLKKFDDHFGTKPNITVARYKFFVRNQEEGESIDQWVTALRVLTQTCKFGKLTDELIRDRIVCGINNNVIRDRLFRTEDLTLAKAVQICQAAEMSHEESRCVGGGASGAADVRVDAVWGSGARGGGGARASAGGRRRATTRRGARRGGRPPAGAGAPGSSRRPCATCGGGWCAQDEHCPAYSALCYVCEQRGHFAKMCRQRKVIRDQVCHLAEDDSDEEDGMFYVDVVNQDSKSKPPKEWLEFMTCNNKRITFKLDTGSMLNVISRAEYLNLGLKLSELKPVLKRAYSYTKHNIPIIGKCTLLISCRNKQYELKCIVTDLNCRNILGLRGCVTLGLVRRIDAIQLENYCDLFEGLGKLPGKYKIIVDVNVQPVVCPTRKIPLGLRDKLHTELQRMEKIGVIRKVSHPTEWVNAIVLVAKKNGDLRVCLDPRPLNRAVRRAQYSLPTVSELAVRLRGARYFSVLDARSGFWMVQLDDASADLCTFATPFGRYQFLRLPYGVNCAPEVFHAKLRQYLEDLDGVESFIDDVIVWGSTREEHDARLERLLQRSKEIGIRFNKEKCKFCVTEIIYLGHKFDKQGMRPDDSKVRAIMEMPYPEDRKGLERFLGVVNYLSKFIQNYSDSVAILRGLLKKDSEWIWDHNHSNAVDLLKAKIASAPVLSLYSTELPVVISVDASSVAVGAVLLQGGRPVEFASLTLTDTQTRYAQIEKEMLAICFAVERFKQYIYGRRDVTVQTDHKPLEPLFTKPLSAVPARLQRMMMRIQGFEFRVEYTPGKYMYIADTLSRAPLPELMHDRITDEVELQTCFLIENVQVSNNKLNIIKQQTAKDEECKTIIQYICNGWPKYRWDVSECVNMFWPYRESLQFIDGLIFKNDCVYIPRSLRDEMLCKIHEGHLGIDRCKRRAREVMFWPGMSADVERRVRACNACALHAPAPRREPLLQHTLPDLPWSKLASDIFEYRKKYYIVLVDYFSNYVEVGMLNNMTSKVVINFMKDQFSRHGIPSELVTDNGPAYSSCEFKKFLLDWEIEHVTSSPRYAQSNGKSERTVQTIKTMIKKCQDSGEDFYLSLLNYRSTPRYNLDSPAQMLMGRRLHTKLPIKTTLLHERVDNKLNYERLLHQRDNIKKNYDRSAKLLSPLWPGQRATLIDGSDKKPVTVVGSAPEPRSFVVADSQGRRYRRNRRQLVARQAAPETQGPEGGPSSEPVVVKAEVGQSNSAPGPSTTTVQKEDNKCQLPHIVPPLTRSKTKALKEAAKIDDLF